MNFIQELNSFGSFEELNNGLIKALADKSVFKWAIPQDFNSLFIRMSELTTEDNKLKVISALGRIEAAIKKPVFDTARVIKMLPTSPSMEQVKSGDDRYYAALFIQRMAPEWIFSWSINNFWAEPTAEKTRFIFLKILFEHAQDFDSLLTELSEVGSKYLKENKFDANKVVNRSLRIIKSMRMLCQQTDIDCHLTVGKVFDDFIECFFAHFTSSQLKKSMRENLIPEIVGLILDLVGQRFSLAIEHGHYSALKRIRSWCDEKTWGEICLKHKLMSKLSNTIAEAIFILSRQNIKDGELLARLRDSVSSEHRFADYCKQITKSGHLDNDIVEWLLAGGKTKSPKKTISANQEVGKRMEISDLGDLLLKAYEGTASFEALSHSFDDLELFDPSLVSILKDVSNQWSIICGLADRIASNRSLSLIGKSGQRVDIDRRLFEVTDDSTVNQRYGIVIRPAVVAVNNKTQVVKKGVVKTVEE